MAGPIATRCALVILLSSCVVAGSARAQHHDNPYGVNAHQASDEALQLVADAGIGWVRFDMNWFQMEPAQGQFDWAIPDRFMARADELGLGVFVTVAYTPAWAVGAPCDDGAEDNLEHCLNAVPADPNSWTDFVTAVVQRYGGTVKHWGMWNEPNLDHFFRGTRDEYVELILKPGYDAVHAACADCSVLGPELANLREVHWDSEEGEDFGGLGWAFNGWNHSLARILEDAGDHIDIITHHKYSDPADLWWFYDGMCAVSAGTYEGPWDGPFNQPWPELRKMFWYDLAEDPTGYSWGLLTWDLIPKEPYHAYADVIAANGECLQDAEVGDDDDDDTVGDDDTTPAGDDDSGAVGDDDDGDDVGGCGCRVASGRGSVALIALMALALTRWRRGT